MTLPYLPANSFVIRDDVITMTAATYELLKGEIKDPENPRFHELTIAVASQDDIDAIRALLLADEKMSASHGHLARLGDPLI